MTNWAGEMLTPTPRVILVDDNKDAVDLLSQLLDCFSIENKVAYDGHAGVALVEEWPAHLVIMDIQMPGMNGMRRLRRCTPCRGMQISPSSH